MKRFHKVDEHVFRGGEPSLKDLDMLKNEFSIDTVLSLDGNVAKKIANKCKDLGLKHLVMPIDSSNPSDGIQDVIENLDLIFDKKSKVYVHCLHGKDRTGLVCAMYKITNGTPFNEAFKEAVSIGMGQGFDKELEHKYYDVLFDFKNKNDTNDSDSIVDIQRGKRDLERMNSIVNLLSEVSDGSLNAFDHTKPSFAPYSGNIDTTMPMANKLAKSKIYTITNNVLKPNTIWGTRQKVLSNISDSNGKLYSAEISFDAKVESYRNYFDRTLLKIALLKGADIVQFYPDIIFVANPNALNNIEEEGDLNAANFPMSGEFGSYDGLSPNAQSSSILEDGAGGFAGINFPNITFPNKVN